MSVKTPNVSDMRKSYHLNALSEENVSESPFLQFKQWFKEASDGDIFEANAMALSTVSDNQPHSRVVLLKGFDEDGFIFYTNYSSNKGRQIAENSHVSLLFYWDRLERQVRIEGTVAKISAKASDNYFASRPRGSQLGAWASDQSEQIPNKETLERHAAETEERFEGREIPRPPHWGGYIVRPHKIEFWQGRPNRLHDRLVFDKQPDATWAVKRLNP